MQGTINQVNRKENAMQTKRYLDYGAGYLAMHTAWLRSFGLNVTAHDFGRNFVVGTHDPRALASTYDVVFASNVLNVQGTERALRQTICELSLATDLEGQAIMNWPKSPRKLKTLKRDRLMLYLNTVFGCVSVVFTRGGSELFIGEKPVYHLAQAIRDSRLGNFTQEEMDIANVRPAGCIGRKAVVPRYVLELSGVSHD